MSEPVRRSSSKGSAAPASQPAEIPQPEVSEGPEPFPLFLYFCLSAVLLASCLSISFLWPFVGFMVMDFGLTDDRNEVGYYTGLMLSMFFLGRALSSTLWGYLADYYGRKTVIYICLTSSSLLMLLFGLADSYRAALICRFMAGFMNGLVPVCRAMASEMCSAEHQARAQTFPSVAWQTGLVLGPAIGGILAQPCSQESVIASAVLRMIGSTDGSVFCERPYLLACLAGSIVQLLALPCVFLLPETGPSCACRCHPAYVSLRTPASSAHPERIGAADFDSESLQHSRKPAGADAPRAPGIPRLPKKKVSDASLDERQGLKLEGSQHQERWLTGQTVRLIALNCGMVAAANFAENAISIWCMASVANGGLAWSAERIGEAYSFCGMFSLVFQIFMAPGLLRTKGPLRTLYWSNGLSFPLYFLLPQLGILSPWFHSSFTTFGTFVSLMVFRQICNSVGHTGLAMITNRSVSAAVRCRLQGTMTSVQSAMQAGIPSISGTMFAWALSALPYGGELVFFLSGIISAGNCIFVMSLPQA